MRSAEMLQRFLHIGIACVALGDFDTAHVHLPLLISFTHTFSSTSLLPLFAFRLLIRAFSRAFSSFLILLQAIIGGIRHPCVARIQGLLSFLDDEALANMKRLPSSPLLLLLHLFCLSLFLSCSLPTHTLSFSSNRPSQSLSQIALDCRCGISLFRRLFHGVLCLSRPHREEDAQPSLLLHSLHLDFGG